MLCKTLLFEHYFVPQIKVFTFEMNFSQCSLEQPVHCVTDRHVNPTHSASPRQESQPTKSACVAKCPAEAAFVLLKGKKNEGRSME